MSLRSRQLPRYLRRIVSQPAQTIVLSFVAVIAVGTVLLALPVSAPPGERLTLLDSLFTATSAVCVTGLIVVDTATDLSLFGQIVVLVLIQIGGLGIMVVSFFVIFLFRQPMSVQNRLVASYLLSENDITGLAQSIRRILFVTLLAEAIGTALLALFLPNTGASAIEHLFLALFHAVSAFCNAGFSLYSDGLVGLGGNAPVLLTVSVLIVVGGLSFAVVTNCAQYVGQALRRALRGTYRRLPTLTVNSRVVLTATAVLLLTSAFGFYALEHARSLSRLPLGEQYLTALFQAVTLRTAGFNTIPIGGLATSTLLFMMLFMFVGGASGGTAGGIKVNSAVVIVSYLRRFRMSGPQALLFRHAVSDTQVGNAFTVFLFGTVAVATGTLVLSISEPFSLSQTLFESVSAFGTVGLSTGITGDLSGIGKAAIVVLMFVGRLGPVTIFAASTRHAKRVHVQYPRAEVSIG